MNSFSKLTMGAVGMSIMASIALSIPALAQGAEGTDAFAVQAGSGAGLGNSVGNMQAIPGTGTQSLQNGTPNLMSAPTLQGASLGTIAPQGTQATFVTGVNTAGTVQVNNLANLEAYFKLTLKVRKI